MGEVEIRVQPMGAGGGKGFTVSCNTTEPGSVAMLRAKVSEADGTPPELQRLLHSSRPLPHDATKSLAECGVRGGTVYLMREKAVQCQVVVKSETGDILTMLVAQPASETIEGIFGRVEEAWGAEACRGHHLELQGVGQPLDGGRTVADVGITRGGTLLLRESLLQGAPEPPEASAPPPSCSAPPAEEWAPLNDQLAAMLEEQCMADYAASLSKAGLRTLRTVAVAEPADFPPMLPPPAVRILRSLAESLLGQGAAPQLPTAPPAGIAEMGAAFDGIPMCVDLMATLHNDAMSDYGEALSKRGIRSLAALALTEPRDMPEALPRPAKRLILSRADWPRQSSEQEGWLVGDPPLCADLAAALDEEELYDFAPALVRCGVRSLHSLTYTELSDMPDSMPVPAQKALLMHAPPPPQAKGKCSAAPCY